MFDLDLLRRYTKVDWIKGMDCGYASSNGGFLKRVLYMIIQN